MTTARKLIPLASIITLISALFLVFGSPVYAEDLSDNETCMECHADEPRGEPDNPDMPRIHNEDGSFTVEDHEMWSCIDCHDMITEIPHPEGVNGQAVDCTNCHESTPTK